jgi:hypothetical protein
MFQTLIPAPFRVSFAAILLAAAPAVASEGAGDWQFTFQPYLLLPAMQGSAAVRGFDADVRVGRRDIIDNLEAGFLGYVELGNGRIAFGVDTNYMNLDATPERGRLTASVSQTAVQPMVFLTVADGFELLAGVRYNRIRMELESPLPIIGERRQSREWVDPIIGTRITQPIGGSARFGLLANIGGFGAASDIAVQVRPSLSFQVARWMAIDLGYQWVYMDYARGQGRDRFAYDVWTDGPILGATFRF